MNIDTLLIYTAVTFFYVTSPGPAVILAIVNGMKANMKTVMISSFANIMGLMILSTVSIWGLGVIITTSAVLFTVIKLVGAFYLIYLGIKFLLNNKALNFESNDNKEDKSMGKYFMESFLIAVTNPKPILFFTAIFPQFIDKSVSILPQFLIMTGVFMFISFSSLCAYGLLSKKSQKWIANEKGMTWFNRITGGLFIGLGVGIMQMKSV